MNEKKSTEKGTSIFESLTGVKTRDNLDKQKDVFSMGMFIAGAFVFAAFIMIVCYRSGYEIITAIGLALSILMSGFLFYITYDFCSFTKDAIYENGIASSHHNFGDYTKGRTFHPYGKISTVGHGTFQSTEGERVEFIVLFEDNRDKPASGAFRSDRYKNDFYGRLNAALRENSPHAKWAEMDYDSLPRKYK